ncbi:MAG: hypothetical protein PVI30_12850 [Myxococcales bacterium]|jgi:hypothetical protein
MRWLATVGGAELLLLLAASLGQAVHVSPVIAYAVGFAAVSGSALAVAANCPIASRRVAPLVMLPALALFGVSMVGAKGVEGAMVVTAGLLLGASLVGSAVGSAIDHPGHLIFVAVVSSAADIFSVFHPSGPSAAILESEEALSVLALPWPMLGTSNIEPFLGAGDVVFTGLYVVTARRHGLSLPRTLLALAAAYGLTMIAVINHRMPLPALPFLGLMMVLAHPQAWRPPEADRVRGAVACTVVLVAVAAMFLL